MINQTSEVDGVTTALLCPASKGRGLFEVWTIHFKEVPRGVAKVQKALDAVPCPGLGTS